MPTHIDELDEVALLEVVEHGGVVEVGQVGHVLALLILGRVHLLHLLLLNALLLETEGMTRSGPVGSIWRYD